MTPVVHNLGTVPESEVRAISTYVASVMGAPTAEREARAGEVLKMARAAQDTIGEHVPEPPRPSRDSTDAALQTGAALYAGSCALCHASAQRAPGAASSDALHLSLSSSVSLRTPTNLLRIVLQGMAPADGERGPMMPGFSGAFTDEQVVSLVTYLRAAYSDRPAWPNLKREVRKVRQSLARGE